MLVYFDVRCRFFVVLIFFLGLLVDATTSVSSLNSSAYIFGNSSTDLPLSDTARIASAGTSSVKPTHNASNLPSSVLSSNISSRGNSVHLLSNLRSTGSYGLDVPETTTKTLIARSTETASTNGTATVVGSHTFQNVSTTRITDLHSSEIVTAPISRAGNESYSSNVPETTTKTLIARSTETASTNGTATVVGSHTFQNVSTTRITDLHSSVIVTAPISRAGNESYSSNVPETTTKTLIARSTETASTNGTATVVGSHTFQNVSTTRITDLHSSEIVTAPISRAGNESYSSDVPETTTKTLIARSTETASTNGTATVVGSHTFQNVSTTRITDLHSSEIVTAPISRAGNESYSSVNASRTATPELVLSTHGNGNYKSLANLTEVDSLLNTTPVPTNEGSSFGISRTLSTFVTRTAEAFVLSSLARSFVLSSEPNKTYINNTTILSDRQSTIEWTRTVTTAANFSAYKGSIYLDNSNSSAIRPHIAPSSYHSTLAPLNGSWSSTTFVNKSGKSPDRSSSVMVERTTRDVSTINVLNSASTVGQNSSPRASPNIARTLNVEGITGSATPHTTVVSASLYEALHSHNETSRGQSTAMKTGNKTLTVSVTTASSSTTKLNSSHVEYHSINTAYNTSHTVSAQSNVLLSASIITTRNESQTKEDVFSASASVAAHDTVEGTVSSMQQQQLSTAPSSSRNDMFNTSTERVSSGITTSTPRHSSENASVNKTTTVYSTTPLPTFTSFTDQIIMNTTVLALSQRDHKATTTLSGASQSLAENTSSVNSEEKTTTPVFSSFQFTSSIAPLHNFSLSVKPFTSFASVKETLIKNSQEWSTQSGTQNVFSSVVVSYPDASTIQSTISSNTFSTKHLYDTSRNSAISFHLPSTDTRLIQATVKSSTAGSKSSFSMDVEVNSSYFGSPSQVSSNFKAMINSTAQVYQPGSTDQPSSDLFSRSSSDMSISSSQAVSTSSALPFLESAAKINSVSLVPIFTPCYISYVVTVSRRVMQSLSILTLENKTNTSSTFQQASLSPHSYHRSPTGSNHFRPTPSTSLATEYSSTEILSKNENIPTQSLSRLPDHIESSVPSRHDTTMTEINIDSRTIRKSFSAQLHNISYSEIPISSVAVSSFVSHLLTMSGNSQVSAEIRNYSTILVNHSGFISPMSTPSQNSSLTLLKLAIDTLTLHQISSSVDTYIYSNVSKATASNFTILTSPSFSRKMFSNHISRTPVFESSMTTTGELVYTTKSGSRMPSLGQPVQSSSVITTEKLVYTSMSKNWSHIQAMEQSLSVDATGELVHSINKTGSSHTRTLGQIMLSSSVTSSRELVYASINSSINARTNKNGSLHAQTLGQLALSSSVTSARELVYTSLNKSGSSHTRTLGQPVLSSSATSTGELVYTSINKNGSSSHTRTLGQPVTSSSVTSARELVYTSLNKSGPSHTRTLGQPVLSSSDTSTGELVYASINGTWNQENVYTKMSKNRSHMATLGRSIGFGSHSVTRDGRESSSMFSGSLSNETSRVFATDIALNKTPSSSMLLGTILSTTSAKEMYHFSSRTVDDPIELSRTSHSFSLENSSGNIKTSWNVQATISSNYMLSRSIRNTTAYLNANNTYVSRLSSRFSLNVTNVQTFEITNSTIAFRANATNTQSVKSEKQGVLQPTPVLSRSPTLNNLSVVPSSPTPMVTLLHESSSNQRTAANSTFGVVTDFHNSTLISLSSLPTSNTFTSLSSPNMSIFSAVQSAVQSSSSNVLSLSNQTIETASTYLADNKTTVLTTSSRTVILLHTPRASVIGEENVTLTESTTIPKRSFQFTSIGNSSITSIKPTVALGTVSNFSSQWMPGKSVLSLNSTHGKTLSSHFSFHATQSLSATSEIGTNPSRRKKREVRNQFRSSSIELKNMVPTVNITVTQSSPSPLTTQGNVGSSSIERFLPVEVESLSRTVKTLLTPTMVYTTKVTLDPSFVQTSIFENLSTTTSWYRSTSRLAEESRLSTYNHHSTNTPSVKVDFSLPQFTTSTFVILPKHTNSAIPTDVRNASLVESSSLSNMRSKIVSSTTNSLNEVYPLNLSSSQIISTKQRNSSISGRVHLDIDSYLSNRTSSRSRSGDLISPSFSQKQRIIITSTQSTSTHNSIVLSPSTVELTKSRSNVNAVETAVNNSVTSIALDYGVSNNLSTITTLSLYSPNLTSSISHESYNITRNASESSLSTNMNRSLSDSPTIKDSLYKSTMKNVSSSNPILSTSQQRYETKIHASQSSLNPGIMESRVLMTTSKTTLKQTLRKNSSLYSTIRVNRFTINNTVQAETSLTVLSTANKSMKSSQDGFFSVAPTTIVDENSSTTSENMTDSHQSTRPRPILVTTGGQSFALASSSVASTTIIDESSSTTSENMTDSHQSTRPRPILATTGGQSLALASSSVNTFQTLTTRQKLPLNQTANITAVSSSPRDIPSSTAALKYSNSSVIVFSRSSTFKSHSRNQSVDITKKPMGNSTSKVSSKRLVSQSSLNTTFLIASASSYWYNASTSLMDGNISDRSSSVMTYAVMTPSPSPSFTVVRSKGFTATPILPVESYISSEAVLERSSSLKNSGTVSKLDQTTDVENNVTVDSLASSFLGFSSILSRVIETESGSKATIASKKDTGRYFTHFVIPTSSLGMCFVSYSTILLNISIQSSVTLNTSRVSATAISPTRLVVSSSSLLNSTGVVTSASLLRVNASSKQLLYPSINRTSAVIKASQNSSLVINERSVFKSSQSDQRSSEVTLSTLKSSVYSMNYSNLGHTTSPSLGNISIFATVSLQSSSPKYTMSSLPSILSHTVVPVLPSPTLSNLTATQIGSSLVHSESSSIPLNTPETSTVILISPTVSSVLESSSIFTTRAPTPVDENAILVIALKVSESVPVNTDAFKTNMSEKLNEVYRKGRLVERRRRKRSTVPDSHVEIQNVQRKGEEVDVKYIIIAGNKTVSAQDAADTMNIFSIEKLNEIIGYDVLSRPAPVSKVVPEVFPPLAMLVETRSQNNLSSAAVKTNFENDLASFYKTSAKLPDVQTVKAIVTKLFYEPLGRTYIEFIITVDNVTVERSQARVKFDKNVTVLSAALQQTVLVAPYIPGNLQPTAMPMNNIIQNMQFNSVQNLEAIKQDIANKLTQVYVQAQLKTTRKRRKRALGSIDTVVTKAEWTEGKSADVTYYITDAGSILNATYACSVLKRLTVNEMSAITTPYTVNSSPRPLAANAVSSSPPPLTASPPPLTASPPPLTASPPPLTATASQNTEDDDHPSWFIPVVVAASIGFLLLVLIIILYCRWKKGGPSKRVEPKAGSPAEENVQIPRMTHAAEAEARPALRRPPTAVTVEENGHSEPRPRPTPRKLPVRESSMRRKAGLGRESISTRTNPAYVEEESEDESVTEASVPPSRRAEANGVVSRRTMLETPRRAVPRQELIQSDEEGESEESEEESLVTANTNQHSAATLPTIAVMSDPRSPEIQPPVRFRPTVHPEPSLPPLDLKPTSLIGRVVEEEGSVQKEMKTKADIERWRNKQRQRDKKLGESMSRPGNKRPSFTEKKAWGRAQQQIGSVLDPEAMQPIVRKPRRKLRRKYKVRAETSEDEGNVELRGFKKLTSPREEKVSKEEEESDSDISMGEARRRMIALIDDAFTSIKSASKKHHPQTADQVDAGGTPQGYPPSMHQHPLYPRPATLTPALPEPPPSHGRASVPSARHRRRFMNSQNSLPYPSQYYPGMSGSFSPHYPPPPPPPVVTRNPLVVWDPADKQRILNQSAYRPYGSHPYSYTDPSGKLHFTPVQKTPDGMGGLVWSPYTTEYAMEDFYRNVEMPGTLDSKNSSFLSRMQETPLGTMSDNAVPPRDSVIDMPGEPGTRTGESAEPLVRAIKDELFRLASGRTPVKHL